MKILFVLFILIISVILNNKVSGNVIPETTTAIETTTATPENIEAFYSLTIGGISVFDLSPLQIKFLTLKLCPPLCTQQSRGCTPFRESQYLFSLCLFCRHKHDCRAKNVFG